MDIFKKDEVNMNTQNSTMDPKKSGFNNFMHGTKETPQLQKGPNLSEISKELTGLMRKFRINEERDMNLRKKLQVIEHNMLLNQKKIISEIKFINSEINDIKLNSENLKTKILQLSHQMESMAKKEDFAVLERYISMWEPIHFISRKEAEKLIDEKLNERVR
jgi:hypothetical protein